MEWYLRGYHQEISVFYELHVFLFVFYVYNSDIAGGFRKGSSDQITFIITTSTMETTERNSAVRRNADDQTTINQGAIFLKVADRKADEYDSPVAAWCRIFRNFAMFAKSRSEKDAEFVRLERAMRVSGLDDKEIDNYFSDMMTEKEMRPYIEGARQQGYRKGFEAGVEQGTAEGVEKGIEKGIEKVAKSLLSLGIPVEQIGIATGLSLERIEALRQS